MATSYQTVRGTIPEGSDATLMRMVTSADQLALVPGDVTSAVLNVYDATQPGGNPPVVIYTAPLTIASVMFATAQTLGWTLGGDGYNFRVTVPYASLLPAGKGVKEYRYEVKMTLNPLGPQAASGFAIFDFLVSMKAMLSV